MASSGFYKRQSFVLIDAINNHQPSGKTLGRAAIVENQVFPYRPHRFFPDVINSPVD
jgi:hypothetical protein